MEFNNQISNLELVVNNTPRVFIKWENTEEGRDKRECYERIAEDYTVFYINNFNRNSYIDSTHPFWAELEQLYKTISAESKIIPENKDGWISISDEMPDCWSQHNKNYGSGYILGYTKYDDVIVTQLWQIKHVDGTVTFEWECDDDNDSNIITHWMKLPARPKKS